MGTPLPPDPASGRDADASGRSASASASTGQSRARARGALVHGISTALVAVFCFATVGWILPMKETYWAPIAAIVVMYPARDAMRRAAIDRFVGTAIGSVIGLGCAELDLAAGGHIWIYGAGVLVSVGLCDLLRLENAARLCGVTVTVITLVPRADPPLEVALHRFVEVSYGVACALAAVVAVDAGLRWWSRRRGSPSPSP